jgi:uncharacterized protein YggE
LDQRDTQRGGPQGRRLLLMEAAMSEEPNAGHYVEVVGEASYQEPIDRFHATVALEVRAAKEETALIDLNELVDRCVKRLLAAGLQRDEVEDAGSDLERPWWWNSRKEKQVGKIGRHRLLLKTETILRLSGALAAIENVPANTRESVEVQMGRPTFKQDDTVREDALQRAVATAFASANALVRASGAKVGRVVRIEEGVAAARHSGFTGDEDWTGDYGRFAAGGAGVVMESASPSPALSKPQRTIWVKCRVRYELKHQ